MDAGSYLDGLSGNSFRGVLPEFVHAEMLDQMFSSSDVNCVILDKCEYPPTIQDIGMGVLGGNEVADTGIQNVSALLFADADGSTCVKYLSKMARSNYPHVQDIVLRDFKDILKFNVTQEDSIRLDGVTCKYVTVKDVQYRVCYFKEFTVIERITEGKQCIGDIFRLSSIMDCRYMTDYGEINYENLWYATGDKFRPRDVASEVVYSAWKDYMVDSFKSIKIRSTGFEDCLNLWFKTKFEEVGCFK